MSKIQVNEIVNHFDTGAPDCPKGLTITGIVTATTADFSGNVSIGGTLTYEDVTNIDSVGIITAQSGIVIGTGTSIGNPENNELGLYTNSTERARIDSSGRLLVGTSTDTRGRICSDPATNEAALFISFTVNSPANSTQTILTESSGGATFLVIGTRGSNGSGIYIAHRGSSTATLISSAGTWAGALSWSGNNLRGGAPAAGNVIWSVIRFNE